MSRYSFSSHEITRKQKTDRQQAEISSVPCENERNGCEEEEAVESISVPLSTASRSLLVVEILYICLQQRQDVSTNAPGNTYITVQKQYFSYLNLPAYITARLI